MDAIEVLTGRVSPAQLVEPGPSKEQMDKILLAGARAPDHGKMAPWRFIVIEGEARKRLGEVMAQSLLRREHDTPPEKLESERKKALRSPTVVIVAAAIKDNPKIPDIEQVLAAGAATQNIVIAAHALGLGGWWRTGDFVYDNEVKREFGLSPSDNIVGVVYLGSVGAPGRTRNVDVAAVTTHW